MLRWVNELPMVFPRLGLKSINKWIERCIYSLCVCLLIWIPKSSMGLLKYAQNVKWGASRCSKRDLNSRGMINDSDSGAVLIHSRCGTFNQTISAAHRSKYAVFHRWLFQMSETFSTGTTNPKQTNKQSNKQTNYLLIFVNVNTDLGPISNISVLHQGVYIKINLLLYNSNIIEHLQYCNIAIMYLTPEVTFDLHNYLHHIAK